MVFAQQRAIQLMPLDPAPRQVNPGAVSVGRMGAHLLCGRACGPTAPPLDGRDGAVLEVALEPAAHHRQRAMVQRQRSPEATQCDLIDLVLRTQADHLSCKICVRLAPARCGMRELRAN